MQSSNSSNNSSSTRMTNLLEASWFAEVERGEQLHATRQVQGGSINRLILLRGSPSCRDTAQAYKEEGCDVCKLHLVEGAVVVQEWAGVNTAIREAHM